MSDSAYRELARRIVDLEQGFKSFAAPQLGHSSLEGRPLRAYNENGDLMAIIGQQADGSVGFNAVNGPTPPMPLGVTAVPAIGAIHINWDGSLDGDVPGDWLRAEVLIGTSPEELQLQIPRRTIESYLGGQATPAVSYDTDYYVALRIRATTGKAGPLSEVVGPVRALKATAEDLDVDFELLAGTTIFYGPEEPTTDRADLWLKTPENSAWRFDTTAGEWVLVQDQGIVAALQNAAAAQEAAAAKATIFTQPEEPEWSGPDGSALWYDTDDGNRALTWNGSAFVQRLLGTGSIQPGSLIASTVIATGTVSAALLESVMILTTTVIAGDPLGNHARMTTDGFRVYRADPLDGVPDEVVRMGTNTNDYFGVVNSSEQLVASIDDTGVITGRILRSNEEPIVMGKGLRQVIAEESAVQVGFFEANPPGTTGGGLFYGPVQDAPVGIAEVNGMLVAGRRYEISWEGTWMAQEANTEVGFVFRYSGAVGNVAPAPTVTSPNLDAQIFTASVGNRWLTASGKAYFIPTVTGRHRFLLTFYRGQAPNGGSIYMVSERKVSLDITDTGPARPITGSLSQGGGAFWSTPAPPPPTAATTQQYYVDVPWSGRRSWRGDGSEFPAAGTDVYQGYSPYAGNGDMCGMYWFNLPNITGTVDRVDLYTYSRHWYYNAGGTAIINLSDHRGTGRNFFRFKNNWYVPGYPKGGTKVVTLPPDWWALFRGTTNASFNGRATAVTFGPGGGTNLQYYGVFTDCRLRIWYTQ